VSPPKLCPLAIVLAGVLGFGVAHADPPIEASGSGSVATSSADLSLPPDAVPPDARVDELVGVLGLYLAGPAAQCAASQQ
jgi:hypothetical protein